MAEQLIDLTSILQREEDPGFARRFGRSPFEEEDFIKASQALLSRQFLYAENRGDRKSYNVVTCHMSYFEKLFAALGMRVLHQPVEKMVGVLPGEISIAKQRLKLVESIFLLVLREVYQHGIDDHQIGKDGVVCTTTNELKAVYEERSHRDDLVNLTELKSILDMFSRRSVIQVEEFDGDRNAELRIMPSIVSVAGNSYVTRMEAYLEGLATSDDSSEAESIEETDSTEIEGV